MGQWKRPTFVGEAVQVLAEQGPTYYRDLADAVLKRGRVKIKSKNPAQTLSAGLTRRRDVERVAPGVYRVKEGFHE